MYPDTPPPPFSQWLFDLGVMNPLVNAVLVNDYERTSYLITRLGADPNIPRVFCPDVCAYQQARYIVSNYIVVRLFDRTCAYGHQVPLHVGLRPCIQIVAYYTVRRLDHELVNLVRYPCSFPAAGHVGGHPRQAHPQLRAAPARRHHQPDLRHGQVRTLLESCMLWFVLLNRCVAC